MSKVYLSPDCAKILEQINFSQLGEKVAIKVHFGEKGCNTYLDPELARKIYEKVKSLGKEVALVECNVLYKGSRVNRTSHIKTAQEHGFTDMEIDILDGEEGKDLVEINGCKIGAGIKKYDSLIALTHFKGHGFAGFGGALKNVGMGLGSRAGKLHMHSKLKPVILAEQCTGCGTCVQNCDAQAVSLIEGKAKIDEQVCVGCAMCIAVCPYGAASIPWEGGTTQDLQEKIARYAAAVISLFKKPIYINVLQKITAQCDCMGVTQQPMMDDVGILYSEDVVAVDQASLDLAIQLSHGQFEKINAVDKGNQITLAQNLGLGDRHYELTKI